MSTPSVLLIPDLLKAGKLYSQIPNSGAVDFDVTRATTAYRTNASGILESVASGVPRLDYPIGGGCPSLLVEPAATNLFLNSVWAGGGTPPTSWSTPFITGSATAAISTINPSVAAYLFVTSAQRAVFSQNISQTSGTIYTHSIYVESVTGTLTVENLLNYNISIAGISTFREDGGTILATHVVQAGKRYSLTITAPSTASAQVRIGNGVSSNTTATIRLSSPQIETGSVATSYIPTTAATATRNADVISKTGVSGFIGQTEGTVYAEVDIKQLPASNARTFIDVGSSGNRVFMGFTSLTSNTMRLQIDAGVGGTACVDIRAVVANAGIIKVAVAYQSLNCALYVNGVQATNIQSNIAFSFTTALSALFLGSTISASAFVNDRIRTAAIYPTRLTNSQLSSLTTL
jgi:hypothetical protein